jgi:phosphate transport system permease protein
VIETSTAGVRPSPTLRLGRLMGDFVLQSVAIIVVVLALVCLGALLYDVFADGWGRLNWQFLTSIPSRRPAEAGIYAALIGTLWLIGLTTLMALPVGVAAAIYLEEYGRGNWLARIIEINIANLAGVPSII